MRLLNKMTGFTLLEIIISLFILSFIGMIITTGMHLVVETEYSLSNKIRELTQVQLALTIIEGDFQQIVNRPVLDENGVLLPSLIIEENSIEFTRSGFMNPLADSKRSTLQRVSYTLVGDDLIRQTWEVLDRENNSTVDRRTLISNVKRLKLLLLESNAKTSHFSKNLAISIELELDKIGYIKRIINLAATSFTTSETPSA